ncbi:MAG: PAS domain S-box protein, partial [Pyrinomonadaceae bacterium]
MEDDLGRVLNVLPGLVWAALPDGQIDFVNQRWCEYTGLRVDEACGCGWQTAIHPEDLPELLPRWQSILASGESGEMEARLRRFDGDYHWLHISASPSRDAAGEVVKWYGVSTDIEERRRAEEALRVRELSFRLIVDSIPAPVAVTTPSGEVEALNQPTLEYFGKTYEELKGWKNSDVVHPDDLQRTVAAQVEAHETGSAYNVESRHRRADGVYRWFNVLGLPLRDTEGHILRWFILQIDIDDRKRAEEALRSVERDLNQIINTIPALAWSAGKDGSAEFFNQQYLDFVGLSAEEASGLGWTAAVHPDDLNSLVATWASIVASEEPGEAEARMRGHDGEYRWFLFRASPVRDEKGNIVKWYGINTDIDDLKKAEAAQQSSERNLSLTINTIPTFIQVSRPDGTVLSVNQAVLDYHGISLQDVQKEDFRTRVYHPDDVKRLREERKEALKRPLQFEYEQRARGKDGKYRWFLIRYNPLLDDQGRIDRWYATAFDIEDRKRAE